VDIDLQGYTPEEAEQILFNYKQGIERRRATFEQKKADLEQYYIENPDELAKVEAEKAAKQAERNELAKLARQAVKNGFVTVDGQKIAIQDLQGE